VLNPLRQAARFDHDGDYVRRYVPELANLAAPYIHAPWKLARRAPQAAELSGPA
jgi:deoxyribodipyrimidine photo-lyase